MKNKFYGLLAVLSTVAVFGFEAPTAEAATISSQTNSTASLRAPYYSQGLTLGSGGDWNNIRFAFDQNRGRGFTAYAAGDLFIMTEQYAGSPRGLSSSSAGYVGQSNGISNGYWTFDSNLTLQSDTTYYFVMGDRANPTRTRIYGRVNGTAPGLSASFGTNRDYTCCANTNDFDHRLRGQQVAPIPLPASALLLMIGIGGLGVASFRRKST